MKANSLSWHLLKFSIKKWGQHCKDDPNYKWTKHDENTMFWIDEEVKKMRKELHDKYLKRRDDNIKKNTTRELPITQAFKPRSKRGAKALNFGEEWER